MLKRAITGGIFVAILVLAILYGELYFHVLFGLIAVISLHEFYKLFPRKKLSPNIGFGLSLGIVFYFAGCWTLSYDYNMDLLIGVSLLCFPLLALAELFRKHKAPFQNIAITILGWVYIVFPLILLHLLMWDFSAEGWTNYLPVLTLFLLVWTSDTFAYLIGKNFGKNKLFERISPNKTWEGFIGGLIFTLVVAYVVAILTEGDITFYLGLAAIIASFGTLGDLVESMLKRSLGIKDSGTILPGHGGLLDRIDAVLYVIPIVYFYYSIN